MERGRISLPKRVKTINTLARRAQVVVFGSTGAGKGAMLNAILYDAKALPKVKAMISIPALLSRASMALHSVMTTLRSVPGPLRESIPGML